VDTSANEPLVVERRADLVMLLGNPQKPELAVVMEIQLNEDGDKPFTWPQYVGVELGHRVGAARVKGRGFFWGDYLHQAVQLAGAGLVKRTGVWGGRLSSSSQRGRQFNSIPRGKGFFADFKGLDSSHAVGSGFSGFVFNRAE
jgi:hypothetical protein